MADAAKPYRGLLASGLARRSHRPALQELCCGRNGNALFEFPDGCQTVAAPERRTLTQNTSGGAPRATKRAGRRGRCLTVPQASSGLAW
jgi:hypothetical protein